MRLLRHVQLLLGIALLACTIQNSGSLAFVECKEQNNHVSRYIRIGLKHGVEGNETRFGTSKKFNSSLRTSEKFCLCEYRSTDVARFPDTLITGNDRVRNEPNDGLENNETYFWTSAKFDTPACIAEKPWLYDCGKNDFTEISGSHFPGNDYVSNGSMQSVEGNETRFGTVEKFVTGETCTFEKPRLYEYGRNDIDEVPSGHFPGNESTRVIVERDLDVGWCCSTADGTIATLFRGKCSDRFTATAPTPAQPEVLRKHHRTCSETQQQCEKLGAKFASACDQTMQAKLLQPSTVKKTKITGLQTPTWFGLQPRGETGSACWWHSDERPLHQQNESEPTNAVDKCSITYSAAFLGVWTDGRLYKTTEPANFWVLGAANEHPLYKCYPNHQNSRYMRLYHTLAKNMDGLILVLIYLRVLLRVYGLRNARNACACGCIFSNRRTRPLFGQFRPLLGEHVRVGAEFTKITRASFSNLKLMEAVFPCLSRLVGMNQPRHGWDDARRYNMEGDLTPVDQGWLRDHGVFWPTLRNASGHDCSFLVALRWCLSSGSFFRFMVRESMDSANHGGAATYEKYDFLGELRFLLRGGNVVKDLARLRSLCLPDEKEAVADVGVITVLRRILESLNEHHRRRFQFNVDRLAECTICHTMNRVNRSVNEIYFWCKLNRDYTDPHDDWQQDFDFGNPKSWPNSFQGIGYSLNSAYLRVCSLCSYDKENGLNIPSNEDPLECPAKERLTDAIEGSGFPRYLLVFPHVNLPCPDLPNGAQQNRKAMDRLRVTPHETQKFHGYWLFDKKNRKTTEYQFMRDRQIEYRLTGYALYSKQGYDHIVWRCAIRDENDEETGLYLHCDDEDVYRIDKSDYIRDGAIQFLAYESVDRGGAVWRSKDDRESDNDLHAMTKDD